MIFCSLSAVSLPVIHPTCLMALCQGICDLLQLPSVTLYLHSAPLVVFPTVRQSPRCTRGCHGWLWHRSVTNSGMSITIWLSFSFIVHRPIRCTSIHLAIGLCTSPTLHYVILVQRCLFYDHPHYFLCLSLQTPCHIHLLLIWYARE